MRTSQAQAMRKHINDQRTTINNANSRSNKKHKQRQLCNTLQSNEMKRGNGRSRWASERLERARARAKSRYTTYTKYKWTLFVHLFDCICATQCPIHSLCSSSFDKFHFRDAYARCCCCFFFFFIIFIFFPINNNLPVLLTTVSIGQTVRSHSIKPYECMQNEWTKRTKRTSGGATTTTKMEMKIDFCVHS